MRFKWKASLMATLSLINVVSTGHVNYVSKLYCPEGYRNLRLNNTQLVKGDWAGAFEEQCQCKSGAQCRRDVRSNSYSCSTFFGGILESGYEAKIACIIHDMCYECSWRERKECDWEFYRNFKEVCWALGHRYYYFRTNVDCELMASMVYSMVRAWGWIARLQYGYSCPEKCISPWRQYHDEYGFY